MREGRTPTWTFQVLDSLDHPHGGQILRLRLQEGEAPTARALKKGRLELVSPRGEEGSAEIAGFAALGGKVSDDRLARTGRVDLHVYPAPGEEPLAVGPGWTARASGSS